jgi:rod shape-determining protein MreC
MAALNPQRSNALLLVALLFAQLLLMAGSLRDGRGARAVESGLMRVTRPVVGVAGGMGGALRRSFRGWSELWGARADNERLRSELHRLHQELGRYREMSLENPRLRRLLHMREDLTPRSVGASVIAAVLSDQEKMIVVDRGTEDGVQVDRAVVGWGGAVGRVVAAGPRDSKVRLLVDPSSGVAGIVQRTRVEGMVWGQGSDPMELKYVPRFADVMVGDRVVTSGLDGVFPRGLGIGTVTAVGDDTGISKEVELLPEVDFTALEEVLVLLEPAATGLLDPGPAGHGQ